LEQNVIGIPTKIDKRGLVDLYADDFSVNIVVPYIREKKEKKDGYAHVVNILNQENIE